MGKKTRSSLDRLFARSRPHLVWPAVRDAWDPAWQPRGRWWMRTRKAQRSLAVAGVSAWRRLTRPARAA